MQERETDLNYNFSFLSRNDIRKETYITETGLN